jgi:translation initiation factor 3 subunit A
MLLLVELSVEQKKGKLAKDALYQYKNICQNTNVGTIEVRQIRRKLCRVPS